MGRAIVEALTHQNSLVAGKNLQRNRIGLFIDGANLAAATRMLDFEVDYKRLLEKFKNQGNLLRTSYYTAVLDDVTYSSVCPLIDWLNYNGYTVVTGAAKDDTDSDGRRRVSGNMDVQLSVDAWEIARHVDQAVIFSGNGNLRYLVAAIQRRGVHVTVVSTIATRSPVIADELRRQADVFIDLMDIKAQICRESREPRYRAAAPSERLAVDHADAISMSRKQS